MIPKIILTGVGSMICASAAVAGERDLHVMNVTMPDGTVRQLAYKGDVPPRLIVVPVRVVVAPRAVAAAQRRAQLARLDRMRMNIDRQMAAMMRQAASKSARAPAGTISYSYVSTSTHGAGRCTRSFRMISAGRGQQPKMIAQSSGDCPAVTPVAAKQAEPARPAPRPKAATAPRRPTDFRKTI